MDDIALPGMLHAAILRSPHAHALIRRIDTTRALEVPGVYGVLTGREVAEQITPERGRTYPAGGEWYFIATDRVRYVGDPVAVVAATDRYVAEDALDLIEVEYDELPAVLDPEHAADPDQPELHPGAPGGNRVASERWSFGDPDGAFTQADVRVRERLVVHRYSSTPMECLAVIASHDPLKNQVTVWANIGNLNRYPAAVKALRVDNADMRLIVPDVGGSFGIKAWVHHKAVLMAVLAKQVGRPVKWTEDRLEHLIGSHHAEPRVGYVELAARKDGTILGFRMRTVHDQGAYVSLNEPAGPVLAIGSGVTGLYDIRNVAVEAECVVTNRCPVASNRGYGRVQHFFLLERAIDRLARALDMDPVELRRKNAIPATAFPYTTASGGVYDSGDPPALLEQTLEVFDLAGARREQAEARKQGRLLGVGVAMTAEAAGPDQARQAVPFGIQPKGPLIMDVATIRLTPEGRIGVRVPTLSQGQSHETAIAQIVADQLGTTPEDIDVNVGFDSYSTPYSPVSGTYGSRFHSSGAPAAHGAATKMREQLARLAAVLLEAAPDDVEFVAGQARVRGVPDRSISLERLARTAYYTPGAFGLAPDEVAMETTCRWNWPLARATATHALLCHAALVEVDARTGRVSVLRYVAVEDVGRIVNPQVVVGQLHGGVMHGVGAAMLEQFAYDERGQILSNTFMDYLIPRFTDAPPLEVGHLEIPTPIGPLGMKGASEGGAVVPPAALGNAVEDAIHHLGARIESSHLSPETVLRALRGGRVAAA